MHLIAHIPSFGVSVHDRQLERRITTLVGGVGTCTTAQQFPYTSQLPFCVEWVKELKRAK
jgi:hypothetical protein